MARVAGAQRSKIRGSAKRESTPVLWPDPILPLEDGALLGWADFTRNGGEIIKAVAREDIEVSLSTGRVPQMRLRAAELGGSADVDEEGCISFKEMKADLGQYRALVMMGEGFTVSSGSARVIADRHPDCPHGIIDQYQKRWRSGVRATAQSQTRKHAKDAARGTAEVIRMLERFRDDTERRIRERVKHERGITELLEQALKGTAMTERQQTLLNRLMIDKGVLKQVEWETTVVKLVRCILNQRQMSDEQRALLDQVMRDEGIKAALEERRWPGADDLDRTEVD